MSVCWGDSPQGSIWTHTHPPSCARPCLRPPEPPHPAVPQPQTKRLGTPQPHWLGPQEHRARGLCHPLHPDSSIGAMCQGPAPLRGPWPGWGVRGGQRGDMAPGTPASACAPPPPPGGEHREGRWGRCGEMGGDGARWEMGARWGENVGRDGGNWGRGGETGKDEGRWGEMGGYGGVPLSPLLLSRLPAEGQATGVCLGGCLGGCLGAWVSVTGCH